MSEPTLPVIPTVESIRAGYPQFALNNTTPFTYRDGLTFLEILEILKLKMNEIIAVVDDQNTTILEFVDYTLTVIEQLQTQYENFTEEQLANYQWLLTQLVGQYIGIGDGIIEGTLLSGQTFRMYTRERVESDGLPLFLSEYPADCTAEINAQIADGVARGVKKFCIKSGTFMMQNVEVPSTCTLEGAGASTFLRPTPGANAVLIARARTHIKDMEINLRNEPCVGILVDEGSRAQFSNLWVNGSNIWTDVADGSPGTGIRLQGTASDQSSHACMFTNVRASRLQYGIYAASWSYDAQFVDVWIAACKTGMRLNDGGHALTNVHVWESKESNIYLYGPGGSRIVNCYAEKSFTAWGIQDVTTGNSPNFYSGVYAWRNALGGIRKQGKNGAFIVGCVALENSGVGYSFHDTTGVLTGSYSGDRRDPVASQRAVEVTASVADLIVAGNVFKATEHVLAPYNINSANNIRLDNNIDYVGARFERSSTVSGQSTQLVYGSGYAQTSIVSGANNWSLRGDSNFPNMYFMFNGMQVASLNSAGVFNLPSGGSFRGGATGLTVANGGEKLAFFGAVPVTREAVAVNVNAIHAALVRLGLIIP